ncbi:MAG: hypothetical protein AAF357_16760, partial [Verrucomicrobiota bacterium]
FSSDSEATSPGDSSRRRQRSVGLGRSSETLETRMDKLESKLDSHATDLKAKVTDRVERIESRIQRAMTSLTGVKEGESAGNVIEFSAGDKVMHHLPAASAISALNELNSTLKQTREHLDALSLSVDQMRRAIPPRQERESA